MEANAPQTPQPAISESKADGTDPSAVAERPRDPLIIESSARSLLGKFAFPVLLLLGVVLLALYLRSHASREFANLLLAGCALIAAGLILKALLNWLRIRNTEYAVYPRQVQESSYLFKFLGARNNTVKLNEIKQIKCYSNCWLDVWFFNCGKIQIVTSGDNVDFIMENVHDPMEVKDQLEQRIFGEVAQNEAGLRASPPPASA